MVHIIIMLTVLPGLHFDLQRCMYLHGLKNMVENAKFRQSYDEGDKGGKGRKGALGIGGGKEFVVHVYPKILCYGPL